MLIKPETEECIRIKDIPFGGVFQYEGDICMRISNVFEHDPHARVIYLKDEPSIDVWDMDRILTYVTIYPNAILHLNKGC
jgi:hypothetical protein